MSCSSTPAAPLQGDGHPSRGGASCPETCPPHAAANDVKGPLMLSASDVDGAAPTPPPPDTVDNAEADAELLKQQLQLIQLCFAEHEFGIVVDEDAAADSYDSSPSSESSVLSSPSDAANGDEHARRRRCPRGLPAYDPLAFVNGKVQHGVPLSSLSQDLHAYEEYLENKIAQCVNTEVHTAFVNVSGHLVGMRDELSYMERPLTAAMEKLSTVVGQLASTSQRVKEKVEAACVAEMERAFDAMYLKCMVVYETVAYQLDDLAELLNITVDHAAPTACSGVSGTGTTGSSASKFPLAMTSRDGSNKSGAVSGKANFSIAPDTRLSDAALDVLEDVVLLFQELKEICQRLGSLPSRQQEKVEAVSYVAAAERSVLGVLEVVLVHTSQLLFSSSTENGGAALNACPSPTAGNASTSPVPVTRCSPISRQLLGRVIKLYAQAGEMKQFAAVFRNTVLRPPLEAVVSWKAATQARQSVEGTVALLKQMKEVLQSTFLPLLPLLREHYGACLHPTATIVWPIVSETMVKKLPSLYEVGIPNSFQVKYKAAYELLAMVEGSCVDLEELAVLRESPDVVLWIHKWNLNVYAALRVSEVDKALQSVSSSLDRLPSATNSDYHFRLFYIVHQQLLRLFSSSVFLLPCTPWFLRQTVASCYRVLTRVQEALTMTAPAHGDARFDVERPATASASENGGTVASGMHDTLLQAIADAHALRTFLTGQLQQVILGRLAADSGRALVDKIDIATGAPVGERSTVALVTDVLHFASASVCGQFLQQAKAELLRHITDSAVMSLQNLKSVRSAYSHTRKMIPSAASWYIAPALQPLQKFAEEAQRSGFTEAALQEGVAEILQAVLANFVALARETLLTAKKTEESWEKLRRRKEGFAASPTTTDATAGNAEEVSGGAASPVSGQRVTMETATDRDKMTIQLWIDARAMLEVVQAPPLSLPSVAAADLFAPAFCLLRRAEWIQGADIPEPPDVDA
ncbi:hypothetical protein LSCM1_00639 [Leishmania martiniquensis]|uniref:Conserved oligomeric Golgi complex subunit 2 n=1 Tax=Leishmania martiniquensis TaxID=1580590 RepID=A0A836K8X6_9TRYP|nr:hypothetical protein LSCM1_00639 [Leishmania martiniquensis]